MNPNTVYRELPTVTQNAYADLFDSALSVLLTASIEGLHGGFGTKTVKGTRYWYFQFRDIGGAVKQIYVGPESDVLLDLIERHKGGKMKSVDIVQRQAAACIELGCEAVSTKQFRVIRRLAEYGFFRQGGILAGTHAFIVMCNMLGIVPAERMQTQDIDFAHAGKNISVALPSNIKVETRSAIESLQMGFIPISTLNGKPGGAFLNPADPAFRLDFLTARTSNSDDPVFIDGLSVALQPLRFMEFSMEHVAQAVALSQEGVAVVNIPSPDRFAIHKLIVSAERSVQAQIKASKDVRQANVLIQYYLDRRPDDLFQVYRDAMDRGPGWSKRLRQGVDALGRINPGAAAALVESYEPQPAKQRRRPGRT